MYYLGGFSSVLDASASERSFANETVSEKPFGVSVIIYPDPETILYLALEVDVFSKDDTDNAASTYRVSFGLDVCEESPFLVVPI